MTDTTTATLNGKAPRKQLGDQLDRLDSIIAALADGLPGAVADACKEGARAAVKDAVIEILTNPELRGLIAGIAPSAPVTSNATPHSASPPEPTPSKLSLLRYPFVQWIRIARLFVQGLGVIH